MCEKEFKNFVWEEEWIVLDMPYFYFRKYSFPKCWSLNCNIMLHILAFFILGLGSGLSLIVFIFEQLFVKYFGWKKFGTLRGTSRIILKRIIIFYPLSRMSIIYVLYVYTSLIIHILSIPNVKIYHKYV